MITMDDRNLFNIMQSIDKLNDIDENTEFFLNHKFKGENKIPDFILKEQEEIKYQIDSSNQKVINFMAPTSFGKSKILLDIIEKSEGNKIIISPTLSLCNEYDIKIRENKISNTYILTPEKANLFLTLNPNLKFKIVVFDEFYEAASIERSGSFTNCLKTLYNISKKIILISPYGFNISSFIESFNFIEKKDITEISTNTSATSRIVNSFEFDSNKSYKYKKYFQMSQENISGFEIDKIFNSDEIKKEE